jgi:hypothetical protein
MVRGGTRAQVSMEYLFVMGFAVLLLIPLIILYYEQTTRLSDEASNAAASRAVTQIIEAADTVYYLGAPSTRTLVVDFPDNVESIAFNGPSVSLHMLSSHGNYEQVAWSAANLTGVVESFEGPHMLVFRVLSDDRVNITEQ